MICYYCHEAMGEEVDIVNLFKKKVPLCDGCCDALSRWRAGKRCGFCHRLMQVDETACLDCDFLSSRFRPPERITCLLDYHGAVKMLFIAISSQVTVHSRKWLRCFSTAVSGNMM